MYESIDIVRRVIPTTESAFQSQFSNPPVIVNLMHFNGAATSTLFPDATVRHRATGFGNAQIDTSQSVFGGASLLLDGSGDYIQLGDAISDFAFGTVADFTIDCWFRCNSLAANYILYHSDPTLALAGRYFLQGLTDGSLDFNIEGGAAFVELTGGGITVGAWNHLAVTRRAGTFYPFFNGVLGTTLTSVRNMDAKTAFTIGARGDGAAFFTNGWIDEFRVMNGGAAWTSNFIPPTVPYLVNC